MNPRGAWAIGILAAWGVGIAAFAQRELSRSPREKLAEAAARVAPGATYFAVERDGRHVGFASSTIDTIPAGLQVTDYLVADLPIRGALQRTTAQSVVRLSRGLALRDFAVSLGSDSLAVRMTGRTLGDTLLEYVVDAPARIVTRRACSWRGLSFSPPSSPSPSRWATRPRRAIGTQSRRSTPRPWRRGPSRSRCAANRSSSS